MKSLFLTTATAVVLTAAASHAVVRLEDQGSETTYTLQTPVGAIVLTCTDEPGADAAVVEVAQAAAFPTFAPRPFPVFVDDRIVLIGGDASHCDAIVAR